MNRVTTDLALPRLHPGQLALWNSLRKKNIICAGRGWRKSTFMVRRAIHYAMNLKRPVLWTAFTFTPIQMVQSEVWKTVLGEEVWENHYIGKRQMLEMPGWKPIVFRSLEEAQNIRGATPGLIICDEMGELTDGTYDSILAPMRDKTGGELLAAGTPNPAYPYNDFWALLQLDTDHPDNRDIFVQTVPVFGADVVGDDLIRKPHKYELPNYGELTEAAGWEKMFLSWQQTRPSNRKRWRIERLCHFLADEGSQIEQVDRACVLRYITREVEMDDLTIEEYWLANFSVNTATGWYEAGVDIAVQTDYTVLVVMDRTSNQMVYFRRFLPRSGTETGRWGQIYAAIKRVYTLFGCVIRVDTTGLGNHLEEEMPRQGVPIKPFNFSGTSDKKVALMDNLSDLVEGGHVKFFELAILLRELTALKRKATARGFSIKGVGEHDDTATAIALACLKLTPKVEVEPQDLGQIYRPQTTGRNPFSDVIW